MLPSQSTPPESVEAHDSAPSTALGRTTPKQKSNGWSADTRIAAGALLFSGCAVLLSQLPPVYTWLQRAEIRLDGANQAFFTHSFGNLSVNQYIRLHNVGDARGRVSAIRLILTTDDLTHIRSLPAQSYFLQPTAVQTGQVVTQIPLGEVTIQAGETWEGSVSFWNVLPTAEQVELASLSRLIQRDIEARLSGATSAVAADAELIGRVHGLSRSRLVDIRPGTYRIRVEALRDDQVIARQDYSVEILEAQLDAFDDILEDYRYGGGIYFPHPQVRGFWVTLQAIGQAATSNN